MSLLIKKKQILTATLVIALVAATGVNWYYSQYMTTGTLNETTTQNISGNLGESLLVAGTTSTSIETETSTDVSVDSEKYFTESKLKRDEAEDEVIDAIEDILENPNLDSQQKQKISALLSDYTTKLKTQTDAENIIRAKTGSECLVIINEDKCQVILEKNTLNDTLILQITEIIEKNTNISAENLTIIEIK